MMKPSRLFWKLFLAFWLATSLTFLVGLSILVAGSLGPGDHHLDAILASEEQLLEQYGVESGRQLLAVWQPPHGQAIGVYDSAGQLLAGTPVSQVAYEKSLISKDGAALSLRSSHPPHEPGRLGHWIPLIIGTLNNGLNLLGVSSFYQQVVKGVVIIIAVLLDRKNKK